MAEVINEVINEVIPDIDSPCRIYGHVEIAGKLYRIPRASIGPMGIELLEAVDALNAAEDKAKVAAFVELYELAMSRFYAPDTYQNEIENVSFSDIGNIVDVIIGEDQKKSSVASV